MYYEQLKGLSCGEFRRLTGVTRELFEEMVGVLEEDAARRRLLGGKKERRYKASDRLLMMLEYWREYRTFFHIAQSRGLSESQTWKIIRRCEEVLVSCGKFRLPGKKALLRSDVDYEVVLVDATESPVERPKKNSGGTTRVRKSGTH